MLYEIRKALKDVINEKYYADYDGSLVIVKKGNKTRLTSICNKSTDFKL